MPVARPGPPVRRRGWHRLRPRSVAVRHRGARAMAATAYFSSRESRRSLSTRPPVWHCGAVVRLVLGEVDGLDRRPAARARLALAAVDLERHRQLVGHLLADHLLVVVDRRAEHREPVVEAPDLLGVEVASPCVNGAQPRLPEDLVDPERPIPAIARWSRSSGCSWRGWSIAAASASSGGAGHASGPSVATISSASTSPGPTAASPRRAAWCRTRAGAARARRRAGSAPASARSLSEARLSKTCSRPADIRWTSSSSGSSPPPRTATTGIFPIRRTPSIVRPSSASSGGSSVFTATIPGASVDSTSAPASAAPRRRAVISTSGSSGIGPSVNCVAVHSLRFEAGQRTGTGRRTYEGRRRAHAAAADTSANPDRRARRRSEIERMSRRGPRARRRAQRGHPRPQLPGARDPGRRRPHGRLARALAPRPPPPTPT